MSAVTSRILGVMPAGLKLAVKARLRRWKFNAVRVARSYTTVELENELRALGLSDGDAVVMHSAFSHFNGFQGEAPHVIDCILDVIGASGHLMMVSMAYTGASRDYLTEGRAFDVRRTPSKMGMLSEAFRRRKGVQRSANPLHPVLAMGPRARWLVAGHEDLPHSCGPGSPFAKMLELNAKALFFDTDLDVLTFTHYLEDLHQRSAPLAVYAAEPLSALVVDSGGQRKSVRVYPFSAEAVGRRDFTTLYDALEQAGKVRRNRIGNTSLAVLSLRELAACADALIGGGRHLFGPPGCGVNVKPTRGGRLRRWASTIRNELLCGGMKDDARRIGRVFFGKVIDAWRVRRLPALARSEIARDRQGLPDIDPGPLAVIAAALDWLCVAQDRSTSYDGGVARHYSLVSGWASSYPETTGYAIPTLLASDRFARGRELNERAREMLDWLVSIQLPNGGFQGGIIGDRPILPVTFNTGQILLGLAAGARVCGEPRYLKAMNRAADFLVKSQDLDGCWRSHDSPFTIPGERTYDTHVAWGLLEAARVARSDVYGRAALANVRWALTHQRDNGWFGRCCLETSTEPLTHTLGYALRGTIEAYRYSADRVFLDAARKTADALVKVIDADGFIPGRLRSDWSPAVTWACLTGSVQIAACWFLLHQVNGDVAYLAAGRAANRYVRRTVRLHGPEGSRGGVKGSFPINGGYGRLEYLDWAAKFLIDANRLELEVEVADQLAVVNPSAETG
jgi:aminoglycoside N3'-acetyltransferase